MNLSLQIEINALKERNKVLGEYKTRGLDWGWREGFPSKVTLELELTGRREEWKKGERSTHGETLVYKGHLARGSPKPFLQSWWITATGECPANANAACTRGFKVESRTRKFLVEVRQVAWP